MGSPSLIKTAAALMLAATCPCVAQASEVVSGEIDLLELHLGQGSDHLVVESTFAIGGGANQFVLKIDGGSDVRPGFDNEQVQALYSRAISSNVTILAGVRRDLRASSDLTYVGVGVEAALADWLAVEHYVFLSQDSDLTGAAMVTANWQLTERLALEPRVSINWSAQSVPTEALGAGVGDLDGSVRLRRTIGKNADVYVGYVHERLIGQTRSIAVATGQDPQVDRAIIGLGLRF